MLFCEDGFDVSVTVFHSFRDGDVFELREGFLCLLEFFLSEEAHFLKHLGVSQGSLNVVSKEDFCIEFGVVLGGVGQYGGMQALSGGVPNLGHGFGVSSCRVHLQSCRH